MISPVVPEEMATENRPILAKIGTYILEVMGWKITGELPAHPKVVFAVAPHTSNWDFIIALCAMLHLQLKVSFMGKASIFIFPVRGLLLKLGGIPIDRSCPHGVVEQMAKEFERKEKLALGLAPEGTRSKTKEWKKGFLYIAKKANVPVVPVSFHFDKKELKFHKAMNISGDIDEELVRVKSYFDTACAKNPQAV
ncbi:1-acyl-sn-glycerol-3-phosphate acyltransferase [Thalassotalea euphylliae]|uniref:1-acyl-sn-glycerol-3-phosphate acyltransferase n=1 Tax=Thalassotalea euphylliae TaxID=1655234 RepID=UPI00362F1F89